MVQIHENCCKLTPMASHPPLAKGGQDAHLTRLDNLFVEIP
ncbi:MAG: hypothetical protein V7K92_25065 [Nostoc sp.]